jgi:hypothetical protein
MACGCVTIGYHGRGGREFFLPEFSFPIEFGNIQAFAETAKDVLEQYCKDPNPLAERAMLASKFIHSNYSEQVEEGDIVRCWRRLTAHDQADGG